MKLKRNRRPRAPSAGNLADDFQRFADRLAEHNADGTTAQAALALPEDRRQRCEEAIDALIAQLGVTQRVMKLTAALLMQQHTTHSEERGYLLQDDIRVILRPGDLTNGHHDQR